MALKYIGDGAYIHGVPARDLTDDEEKQYGPLIAEQQAVTSVVLYESAMPPKTAKPTNKEGGEG